MRGWLFWLRVVALGLLAAAVAMPALRVRRAVYDVVAVLDITGSMNVRDQSLGGVTVSRIAAEKAALRGLLRALPCGSRLGVAVFVEAVPFLLFEPVEICGNYAALDSEIEAVDWRMGWDSESHISEGLLAGVRMAAQLGANLVFMTDGQEAPPLAWSAPVRFGGVRDTVAGLLVGVGGYGFSPIPRFDALGREIGVFRPGDVPSEHAGMFVGREHLSAVDEGHLQGLAAESGLTYVHLAGGEGLVGALDGVARRRVVVGWEVWRVVPGWGAFLVLVVGFVGKMANRPSFLQKRRPCLNLSLPTG